MPICANSTYILQNLAQQAGDIHHVASLSQTTPLPHFDSFFGFQEDYSMSADFLVERIAWGRNHETAGCSVDIRE